VLHPLVRVVRFAHDAREVLTALAQGTAPRRLQESESFLVLSGVDAELSVKEIAPLDARLLWRMQTEGVTCRYADVKELVDEGVVVCEPSKVILGLRCRALNAKPPKAASVPS
jgi:hypothetical protein